MNQVYRYKAISKQSFHQRMDRLMQLRGQTLLLLPIIEELREEHPEVGARQLYYMIKPTAMGRDGFEQLCFENGFKLKRRKAYKTTTDSRGVIRFPNLLAGQQFTAVNQGWSSDITYYQIRQSYYYLTLIIDVFSRVIVGYSVSRRLLTEHTTVPALKMALRQRRPDQGLIFHSDAGGQYYSKEFLELTQVNRIKNSMCEVAWENPYSERINGTIKNQYLKGYNPQSFVSLVSMTKRAINNYNQVRPHQSLKNMTPKNFESSLPAGGSCFTKDNLCTSRNITRLEKKDHPLKNRSIPLVKTTKSVEKTVNVY